MNGRTGLSWVTALTIASLLLGGGVLNALAEGHGGGNAGGNGKATVEHPQQQQQKPAQAHKSDEKQADAANHDAVPQAAQDKHDDAQAKHDEAQAKHDEAQAEHDAQNHNDNDSDGDNDNDKDKASLERGHGADKDRDLEDLVTGPDRVTGDDRPGLGCGDMNHEHTGAPGNPDKECKDDHGADDDETAVATVDQDDS
jgi:hypothetical protein